MRIKVIYNNIEFVSVEMIKTPDEIKEYITLFHDKINNLDKMKMETDKGFVILPQNVIKNSIISIEY